MLFKKILIANRGEIAIRIIRTCKEMNIKTVSIHTKIDKNSLHTKLSDETICIGKSYLNIKNIIAAAEITNANAIHPGYGFLSENYKFSKTCKSHNIKFIGPSYEVIKKMSNKTNAKKIMKKNKLNIIWGSKKSLKNFKEGLEISKYIGFPIILKIENGGGGKGIKIVKQEKDFKFQWKNLKIELKSNNKKIYVEKFIKNPKHIEFQIIGNPNKKVYHLSERECSIQNRYQKLIEETPSLFVKKKIRKKIGNLIINTMKYIKYEGVGTIEFMVDERKKFYFIEMNARIQVEHTITEELTNIDIVKKQIYIAANKNVIKKNFYPKSHIIQCRINAEDANNNFNPSPGKIKNINFPGGKGVRIDSFIYPGYNINYQYDSMIAKIITKDKNRNECIKKMKRALGEFKIEGIKTTIPFHIKIMNNKKFILGNFTTEIINEWN